MINLKDITYMRQYLNKMFLTGFLKMRQGLKFWLLGHFKYYYKFILLLLFPTDEQIYYKDFRRWFLKHPLYECTSDKTINDFEEITTWEWGKEQLYKEHLKNLTYEKLYNKVLEIDDQELNEKFKFICDFFKNKVICGCVLGKLI